MSCRAHEQLQSAIRFLDRCGIKVGFAGQQLFRFSRSRSEHGQHGYGLRILRLLHDVTIPGLAPRKTLANAYGCVTSR